MPDLLFSIGSFFAGLGVALGAFGAHALRRRLLPERLETFETGVRYQVIHSLALLLTGLALQTGMAGPLAQAAGGLFIAGVALFSGSLYLLVWTGRRWFGAITPFGGVAWIAGWLLLGLSVL